MRVLWHSCRSTGWMWILLALFSTPAVGQDLTWFDAIRTESVEQLRTLLTEGADPNRKVDAPGSSMTPLAIALIGRQENVALLLLEHGADMERADDVDVLDMAAQLGFDRVLSFLFRQDPSRFSSPELHFPRRGLEIAAVYGHFDVIELMLQLSLDLEKPVPVADLRQALLAGLASGYDDIARRVLEHAQTPYSGVLAGAAYVSSPGMVRKLLDRGADPLDVYDMHGRPRNALQLAMDRHTEARSLLDQEVARLVTHELIASYAYEDDLAERAAELARDGREELNALATESPQQAFVEAARYGYYDVVRNLVQAELPSVPRESRRAVMADAVRTALLADHDDIARLLLESGAPFDGGVLHAAVRRSSPGVVRYVLSLGADPAERFEDRTPVAVLLERLETDNDIGAMYVMYELLIAGADVCWLTDYAEVLNLGMIILSDRAPHCWPDRLQEELSNPRRSVR